MSTEGGGWGYRPPRRSYLGMGSTAVIACSTSPFQMLSSSTYLTDEDECSTQWRDDQIVEAWMARNGSSESSSVVLGTAGKAPMPIQAPVIVAPPPRVVPVEIPVAQPTNAVRLSQELEPVVYAGFGK